MSSSKPGEIFASPSDSGCLSFTALFLLMVFGALFVYFYLPLTKSYREATVEFAHQLEESRWYPVNSTSDLSDHPLCSSTPIKAEVRGKVREFDGQYAVLVASEYRELDLDFIARPISEWREMSEREYLVPRYEVDWEMGGTGDVLFGVFAFFVAMGVLRGINWAGREIVKALAGTSDSYGQ
jgi:hypothetical protein